MNLSSILKLSSAESEEDCELLKCHFIQNDMEYEQSEEKLYFLVKFYWLVCAHLKSMPPGYVARNIFDPRQQNLILCKKGK